MNCYFCITAPAPGGLRWTLRNAVGVCKRCGRRVCHAPIASPERVGEPLLCPACANQMYETSQQKEQSDHVHEFDR